MLTGEILEIILILATLFCSLVAGFVLAFALVVMPGIKNLNDREFIRAFQVMDGIIQNNQPIFVLIWLGSILALVASVLLGIFQLDGIERLLIIFSAIAYLLFVQLPTFTINIPLNNKLQTLNVDDMDEINLKTARIDFEARWLRWNSIRTVVSILVSTLLMILLFKL